jgi:hypothetical protein
MKEALPLPVLIWWISKYPSCQGGRALFCPYIELHRNNNPTKSTLGFFFIITLLGVAILY